MFFLNGERGSVSSGITLLIFMLFFMVFITLFSTIHFIVEANEIESTMSSIGHALALDLHYREYGDQTNSYVTRFIKEEFPELDKKIDLNSLKIILASDMNEVCASNLKQLKNQNITFSISSLTGIGSSVNTDTVGQLTQSQFNQIYSGDKSIVSFINQFGGNAVDLAISSYPEAYAKDNMIIIAYKLQPNLYPKLIRNTSRTSGFDIDEDSTANDMPYQFIMDRIKLPFERSK